MLPSAAPHSRRNSVTGAPLQRGAFEDKHQRASAHEQMRQCGCLLKNKVELDGASLTSQLTTTQLGDLHVVDGALHCSGAPGPVVTSQRSESGPNYLHKRTNLIYKNHRNVTADFRLYLSREVSKHASRYRQMCFDSLSHPSLVCCLEPEAVGFARH